MVIEESTLAESQEIIVGKLVESYKAGKPYKEK